MVGKAPFYYIHSRGSNSSSQLLVSLVFNLGNFGVATAPELLVRLEGSIGFGA